MESKLFYDENKVWHSQREVIEKLNQIGSAECDVLFIHSDISFGLPNRAIKRKDYLDIMFKCISQLGVQTVIYPTFTYSFCNGENYDISCSKTSIGALNEYARKVADHNRSFDPLLSVVAFGDKAHDFISYQCDNSLGEGSIFDILHHTSNVKFLFFGAEFSNCFTYVHYVEKMLNVKYRFDMPFDGMIVDWNGELYNKRQYIHTACERIKPIDFYHFKKFLIDNGCLKAMNLGDKQIAIISEEDAYYWINKKIDERIDYFLEKPFCDNDLNHIYTYNKLNGKITHC